MPGMRVVAHRGRQSNLRKGYPLGASLTYRLGDLLCLTTLNAVAGGTPGLRLLATADATALYETAANDIVGVLGVCIDTLTTNSSNVISSRPAAATTGYAPILQMPAVSGENPVDSTGKSRMVVDVFDDNTVVGGTLLETTTITEALIDQFVGLDMTVTSSVTAFKWSTAAATKIGRIEGVNKTHRLWNTSGGGGEIFVRLFPAYIQDKTGFNFAT